ncbi:hypothetical protein PR048_033223 [Dryococelus australis]|uniref:Uncharacterized protein n=1 Tax=Dryococelus australis TaxID=614101 RepID=A0ABQ9FZQ0_9NEOP|nr:hypothetical protein PR048_033223 [Dryococelus australis]
MRIITNLKFFDFRKSFCVKKAESKTRQLAEGERKRKLKGEKNHSCCCKAVKKKAMAEIGLARVMLEGVNKLRREAIDERIGLDSFQHTVDNEKI